MMRTIFGSMNRLVLNKATCIDSAADYAGWLVSPLHTRIEGLLIPGIQGLERAATLLRFSLASPANTSRLSGFRTENGTPGNSAV